MVEQFYCLKPNERLSEICYVHPEHDMYVERLEKLFENKFSDITGASPFYKAMYNVLDDMQVALEVSKDFTDVAVIAMGGAALISRLIASLDHNISKKIHFLDTTDPYYFDTTLAKLDIRKTVFLVISNSGSTSETIALTNAVLERYDAIACIPSEHFIFITKLDSTLAKIAISINSQMYPHEGEISGRFSLFTNISTILALLCGINIEPFFTGAKNVYQQFWQLKQNSLPALSALMVMQSDMPLLINWGYLNSFTPLLSWYNQIIVESLAKDTKGWMPSLNLGPQDQHGFLQLYLAGPRDKLFNLFTVESYESTHNAHLAPLTQLSAKLTIAELESCALPIREYIIPRFNSSSIGALAAHMLLEVILIAELQDINPFIQPDIDALKQKIFAYNYLH